MTTDRHRLLAATTAAALALLTLAACVPSAPTPRPTTTSTPSATPDESESATPTPTEGSVEAATVVVTASGISVFGTNGATLVSETYRADAATVAGRLADALGEDPTVTTHEESEGGGCPGGTTYGFGGFEISSPATLGSAGSLGSGDLYSALITAPTTTGGIAIQTVAGQHIGSTRGEFEAAIGDEMIVDEYPEWSTFGFDILNPEAGPYDHIGVQAWFDGGTMASMLAPAVIGFVGDCG